MHTDLLVQGLAGVAALIAAIGLGMCMVLCARSHFSDVSSRMRRFLRR
jgi:hypothetical protein